jgi:hypothetical protein
VVKKRDLNHIKQKQKYINKQQIETKAEENNL